MRNDHLMPATFHHEAVFYEGEDMFFAGTLPFIRGALEAGEPIMVAVEEPKIVRLRESLAGDAAQVRFRDMLELGRNPARIISAWCDFVAEHRGEGTALRGIGEPAWPGRNEAELEECHHHESLLNLAFGECPQFSLLCPYDVGGLRREVVGSALRTHPVLRVDGTRSRSRAYVEPEQGPGPFTGALPEPAGEPTAMCFGRDDLPAVSDFISAAAERLGADERRTWDLSFAVNELVGNSLRHADSAGTVRIWRQDDVLLCEVSDAGRIEDPLVGRLRPSPDEESGRGLWLVNQICDLVQIRSSDAGNVIRLRLALD